MKCGLKEMRRNMNNEVYILTDSFFTLTEKQKFDLRSKKCDHVLRPLLFNRNRHISWEGFLEKKE